MDPLKHKIQALADTLVDHPWHNGVTITVHDQMTGKGYNVGAGQLDAKKPYFATGATKLYVTAILMQLVAEGAIALDVPFMSYLDDCRNGCRLCAELHVLDGVDYSHQITVRHLMSHQSGLGDFFIYKHSARSVQHAIAEGIDTGWTFADVIQRTRSHGAICPPGTGRRANYTDTNYHLLGKVIEGVEGKTFAEVFDTRIAKRLGLSSTYVYCDPADRRPLNLMSKANEITIPLSMASFQSDGGVVTTARESMMFLRAFFEGYLFDVPTLLGQCNWRPMFYPSEFGLGLMRLKVPLWMMAPHRWREPWTMFKRVEPLFGQIGLGGTFLFHAPKAGVYVAGTVNQMADPARAVKFLLKTIEATQAHRTAGQYRAATSLSPG